LEPEDAARLPRILLESLHRAEAPERALPRRFRRHAFAHVLPGFHLDVEPHLGVELAVHPGAVAERSDQVPKAFAQHAGLTRSGHVATAKWRREPARQLADSD